jgi:hypothetical protein
MRRSIFALIVSIAAGCNGPVNGTTTDSNAVELDLVGVDNVQLFDATTMASHTSSSVVSAIVTINEIDAKVDVTPHGHKWVPITSTPVTVDLLKLDNKTLNSLGITTLPQGHVDELRLVLDTSNKMSGYVVLKDGSKHPLELPANGIVAVDGRLDLDSCASGIIILDFDPRIRTEHEHGKLEYELTCRSRIKTEEIKGACNNPGPDMGHGPDMTKPPCLFDNECPSGDQCLNGTCVVNNCGGVVCPGQNEICIGSPPCIPDKCIGVFCTGTAMCSQVDGKCH